jgi:hypothetical protein
MGVMDGEDDPTVTTNDQPDDQSTDLFDTNTDDTNTDDTNTDDTNTDDTNTDDTTGPADLFDGVDDVPTPDNTNDLFHDEPDDVDNLFAGIDDLPTDAPEEVLVTAKDMLKFILRSLLRDDGSSAGTDAGDSTTIPSDVAAFAASAYNLADVLTHPPDSFGQESRALAEGIRDKLEGFDFLGEAVLLGVFAILASEDPAEMLVKGSYDVSDVADALYGLPTIATGPIIFLIEQALVQGRLSHVEAAYWTAVDKRLNGLRLTPH